MKIHFYMFPDHYDRFYISNAKTKDMITCFSNLFGEYPFVNEKYGHAEIVLSHIGAMEHQTCTSFNFTRYHDLTSWWVEWVISHELAHQWWGDLITQKNFHHVWLNEGFATYSSAFWYEYLDGPGAASEYLAYITPYYGPGTVYVENPTDLNTIYDWDLSYRKGAWVLHMLRHTVTDTIFFQILKTYASSPLHEYGTATTEDFQAICEQVSGMNLHKFFRQWIYEEYFPEYAYNWDVTSISNLYHIGLTIEQRQQNTELFWMPIDVKITISSYDTIIVVWDSLETQSFNFIIGEQPVEIELDPGEWIFKTVKFDTSITYIGEEYEIVPNEFSLRQNYPNPFNPTTKISYTIPNEDFITLKIYNILGREIQTLIDHVQKAGQYTVNFSVSNLSSGIFYYRLQVGSDFVETKKMLLLR